MRRVVKRAVVIRRDGRSGGRVTADLRTGQQQFSSATMAAPSAPGARSTCEAPCVASVRALPLLGRSDAYDDTVFNRLQLRVVVSELDHLARASSGLEPQLQ